MSGSTAAHPLTQFVAPAPATINIVMAASTHPDEPSRAGGRAPTRRRTRDSSDPPLAAIAMPTSPRRIASMLVSALA